MQLALQKGRACFAVELVRKEVLLNRRTGGRFRSVSAGCQRGHARLGAQFGALFVQSKQECLRLIDYTFDIKGITAHCFLLMRRAGN
jgi:hypothetical protein